MGSARRATIVDLTPERAYELWTDTSRWPTFVDGFGHVDRKDETWPQPGAKLVWQSVPNGRGQVTERVTHAEPGSRFVTIVFEERLAGTQTVEFTPDPEDPEAAAVVLQLDYEMQRKGPIARLTDAIFIGRAQADALARTLRRFAIEAAEEAAL
jgi:uncharacterized membrane protein